jgi:hypothetical protein
MDTTMRMSSELESKSFQQGSLSGAVLAGDYVEARLELNIVRFPIAFEVGYLELTDVHGAVDAYDGG